MLEGALILLVGIAIGRVLRLRARPKIPKPVRAICGCDHHYSMHDPKTGECHATERELVARSGPIKDDDYGDRIIGYKNEQWENRQCPCRRYAGPEPLPEYYAPEIS